MAPTFTSPSLWTDVTALVSKVAVPVGAVVGFQLSSSTHSFGVAPPPTQVAFWACAVTAMTAMTVESDMLDSSAMRDHRVLLHRPRQPPVFIYRSIHDAVHHQPATSFVPIPAASTIKR